MEKVLLIISVALIIIVLLQSGKANDAGQIISGGNTVLLGKTKERGYYLYTGSYATDFLLTAF